jgi:hypothetical protein
MNKLKQKIISLDKDKIHLIVVRNDSFTRDQFEGLLNASNGVGLRALIIAVKDVEDIKAEEIGKIEIKMADGKVVEIKKV